MVEPPGIARTAMGEDEFRSLLGIEPRRRDEGPVETHTLVVTATRARFEDLMDHIRSHGIHGFIKGEGCADV